MYEVFTKLLNMSLTASILVLVVIILRFVLKKAPKKYLCILWAFVALRLILPFSISSSISAYNVLHQNTISGGQVEYFEYNGKTEKPQLTFEVPALVNDNYSPDSMTVGTKQSGIYMPTVVKIWLAGVFVMFAYAIVSYCHLRKRVRVSIKKAAKVFACDEISSPFILGVIRPRIYLPSGITKEVEENVVAHEKAHIKRLDFIWKPLGFVLLSLYWFNPMMWFAYIFLCKDIEAACDEKVIAQMDKDHIACYSQSLLACASKRRMITACPVAFGETDVKGRIKNVLNYKKPAFWIISVSIIVCLFVGIFFLTDPKGNEISSLENEVTETDEQIYYEPENNEIDFEAEIEEIAPSEGVTEATISQPVKWDDFGFGCWPLADGKLRDEWSEETPYWQFTATAGTPVFAVKDGTAKGGYDFEDGNYVILSLDDAAHTTVKYCHLETQYFETQTAVTEGTEIGTVGASGRATGPFLKIVISNESEGQKRWIKAAETISKDFSFDNIKGSLTVDVTEEAISQPVVMEVALRDNSGNTVWNTEVGIPSAGWNSYYVYSSGDEDYLIEYYPSESQGMLYYLFKMYEFDANGNATIVDERYAETSDEVTDFLEYIIQYMDKAQLFISTINGVITTEM